MDENRAAIGSLLYRKQRLDEQYEELRKLVSGETAGFRGAISASNGKYSQKKIRALSVELTECLKEYRAYCRTRYAGADAKMEIVPLSKEDQSFYETFFYFMVGLSLYNNDRSDRFMSDSGTFAALLERIRMGEYYETSSEMFRDLISWWVVDEIIDDADVPFRLPEGICYELGILCSMLVDGSPLDVIPATERKQAFALMTEEEASLIRKELKTPGTIAKKAAEGEKVRREAENAYWELVESGEVELPDVPDADGEMFLGDAYYDRGFTGDLSAQPSFGQEDDLEKRSEWQAYFSKKEGFANDFSVLFKHLVEKYRDGDLRDEAAGAVELYMAKRGVSAWLNDDDYFTAYIYLNKAFKAIKGKLRRQ
ncbi:MAG: hypothetical protein K6E16_02920 [Lachnospiraceae bacterium]|nr:hypothetical protein [Lachnospiraceae bacterium]